MMCGLAGSGKTYWASRESKLKPEKKYNILGTNHIIDKMKVYKTCKVLILLFKIMLLLYRAITISYKNFRLGPGSAQET